MLSSFGIPDLEIKTASHVKNAIIEAIKSFESRLSDDLEIALIINSQILKLKTLSAQDSNDLLYFSGKVGSADVQIIQHMSQVNLALVAVSKDNPEAKPNRIGFALS